MAKVANPILVLTGPTASGKTALALRLARLFPLEIINADASLIYRGMDIGTAKPSPEERALCRHHLVDILDPDQSFSVNDYLPMAEQAVQDALDRRQIPLVVGGTGFYLRALSQGLYPLPAPDPQMQAELWQRLERDGLEALIQQLAQISPADVARVDRNPRRVVRALEVWQQTGKAPAEFQPIPPRFSYHRWILWPDWDWLELRLTQRVEQMFSRGLVAEVDHLLRRYPSPSTAWQAIGYKEVAAHLRGEISLEQAQQQVWQATRAYARRQFTWFRKEPGPLDYLSGGGEAFWPRLLDLLPAHWKGT